MIRNIIRLFVVIIASILIMLSEIFLKEYKVAVLMLFPICSFIFMLVANIYLIEHDEEYFLTENIKNKGEDYETK